MSPVTMVWKTEKRPADCWDWITPEDVCRHALAAFVMAAQSQKQPDGERFITDGVPWAGRQTFADNLALLFELRLKTEGYQLGVEQDWQAKARQLQKWQQGSEHPKVSTTLPVAPMAGTAMKRSGTEPALSAPGTLKANPEGLAFDAGNGLQNRAALPCAP